MDIEGFLKFRDNICLNFLKNSDLKTIVLYEGSLVMLNFLSELIKEYPGISEKNIEVIVDDNITPEYAREKYFGKYAIAVNPLLEDYHKNPSRF